MESFVGVDPTGSLTGIRRDPEAFMDVDGELYERRVVRPTNQGFEYGNYDNDDVDWTDGDTLRKSSQFKEERRIASAHLAENRRVEMVAAKAKKVNKKLAAARAAREQLRVVGPIDRHVNKRKRDSDAELLDDYNPVDGSSASYPMRKKFAVRNPKCPREVESDDEVVFIEERVKVPKRKGPFTSEKSENPRRKLPVAHVDYRPAARVPFIPASNHIDEEKVKRLRKAKIRRAFLDNAKNAIYLENSINGNASRLKRREKAMNAQAKWINNYADPFKLMGIRPDLRGSERQLAFVAEAVKNLVCRGAYAKQYQYALVYGLSVAMKEFDSRDPDRPVLAVLKAAIRGAYTDHGSLRHPDDPFDVIATL